MAGVLLACRGYGVQRVMLAALLLYLVLAAVLDMERVTALVLAGTLVGGLIAGGVLERGHGYGRLVALAAVPGAVQGLLLLFFPDIFLPQGELANWLQQRLPTAELPPDEAAVLLWMVEIAWRLLPAMVFASHLLVVVFGYRLAQALGPRLRLGVPAALPFRLWRPWGQFIWGPVIGLALHLVGSGQLAALGLNIVVATGLLFAVQGLALMHFFLRRLQLHWMLMVAAYLFLSLTSYLGALVLAGLGLMDIWFDWRRLDSGDCPYVS